MSCTVIRKQGGGEHGGEGGIVAEPELYREYLMWKAIADFGGGEARSVCGGQWVITRDSVLGFIEVGAPPWMSSFPNCSRFRWVAHRVPGVGIAGVHFDVRAGGVA